MKKIKKFEYYIKFGYETGFRVAYPYSSVSETNKKYLSLNEGEYKVPPYNRSYRMTVENIEGILQIRKDLPKESKEIFVTRYSPRFIQYNYERDVYKKTYGDPLKVKIGLEKDEKGIMYICSPILTKDSLDEEILMYLNLFKDLFGRFIICNQYFKEIIKMDLKRQWEILQPGHKKEEKEHIINHLKKESKLTDDDFERKYGNFFKKDSSSIFCGKEGFKGYYVFIYDECPYAIMEKFKEGNATYIFSKEDWEELSKLSKTEVIDKKLYERRILHNKNWNERMKEFF